MFFEHRARASYQSQSRQLFLVVWQKRKRKSENIKMEMSGVKSELNPENLLEGDHIVANKYVKRRRRDSSAAGCKDQQAGLQQQPQADQSAAASTTTTPVKRSSRFRGVSRFIKISSFCLIFRF